MNYSDPLPPIPSPTSAPPTVGRARRPWIIATTAAALVAVAATVTAVVAIASGPDTAPFTAAADKLKDTTKDAEAAVAYTLREGVCANIDTKAVGDWVTLDGDTSETVVELSGIACRASGKTFEDGSIQITAATHPDAAEAAKAMERRKGGVYGATWSDLDDTEWDTAQYANSRIGAPGLLIQDDNLDVAVEVTATRKKADDFTASKAQKVLVKLATSVVNAVADKGKEEKEK